jgi:hypothetical protein
VFAHRRCSSNKRPRECCGVFWSKALSPRLESSVVCVWKILSPKCVVYESKPCRYFMHVFYARICKCVYVCVCTCVCVRARACVHRNKI